MNVTNKFAILITLFLTLGITTATALSVTSPSDGAYWSGEETISWNLDSDSDEQDSELDIYYTTDGGSTFTRIATLDPGTTQDKWDTTAVSDSENYQIRVEGEGFFTTTGEFTVDNSQPSNLNVGPSSETIKDSESDDLTVDYSFTEDNPAKVTFEIIDSSDNVEVTETIDSPSTDADSTYTFDTLPSDEGEYTVEMTVEDEADNTNSVTSSDNLVIDNSPPTISEFSTSNTAISPDNSEGVQDSTELTFEFSDSFEETSGLEYEIVNIDDDSDTEIDSGSGTGSYDWSPTGLSDETYTLELRVTDDYGHEATSQVDVEVDNTAPSIDSGSYTLEEESGSNGILNIGDTVKLTSDVQYSDDIVSESTDLSGLTSETGISPGETAEVVSGAIDSDTKTFTVTVEDDAGNTADIQTDQVSVDNEAPSVTESVPENARETVDVTGWFSTGAGDVDSWSYSYGATTINEPENFDTTVIDDGSYTFTGEATDDASNTGSNSGDVVVDNTAPTTTSGYQSDGEWVDNAPEITLNADDSNGEKSVSGVSETQYCLGSDCDPADGQTGTTVSSTEFSEGDNTLRFRSVDKAGNPESTNEISVKVDETNPDFDEGPSISITSDNNGDQEVLNAGDSFKVSGDVSDTPSGVSEVRVDLTALGEGTPTIDVANDGSFEREFTVPQGYEIADFAPEVTVEDVAGRTTSKSPASGVEVDSQAPGAPSNFDLTRGSSGDITLNWDSPGAGDVSDYQIYVDDSEETTVSSPTTSYTFSGDDDTTYGFSVSAIDDAGNEGDRTYQKSMTADAQSPVFDSASKFGSTTVELTFTDTVSGVDETTIEKGDFSLSAGTIDTIEKSKDGNDATVKLNLESEVDSDTVTVTMDGSISDEAGNTLDDSPSKDVSGMDHVAPDITSVSLQDTEDDNSAVKVNDVIKVTADVSDGSGIGSVKADLSKFGYDSPVGLSEGQNDGVWEVTKEVKSGASEGSSQTATVTVKDESTRTDGPNTEEKTTGGLEVDLTDPSIRSVSPTEFTQTEEDQAQEVTVTFNDDDMNTAVEPTVSTTGSGTVSSTGWSGNDLTFDYTPAIDVEENPTLNINGVEDNVKHNVDLSSSLTVDTVEPTVSDMTLEGTPISDAETGDTNTQTLTVDYSESMDSVSPSIDTDVNDDLATDPIVSGGEWVDSDTYEAELEFTDNNEDVTFDVKVKGAEDEIGNTQKAKTSGFALDTDNPQDPSSISAKDIYEDNVGDYTVDVTLQDGYEAGTLKVRLSDDSSNEVTEEVDVSADDNDDHTIEVTGIDTEGVLEEEEITIDAKYTDDAGNDNSNGYTADTTVHKDVTPPDVESSRTVSRDEIKVTFNEDLRGNTIGQSDFSVVGYGVSDTTVNGDSVTVELDSAMSSGEAPEVTVLAENGVEDAYHNTIDSDITTTPTDTLAPTLSEATTVDSDGDGYIEAVDFKFGESVNVVDEEGFGASGYSGETISDDDADQTVRVEVNEKSSYDTDTTPEVTVTSGAVEDTSSNNNQFASDTTVTSDDGAAPVLRHSEINNADSTSSETKVDLTFTEFVDVSGSATAQLTNEPGELRFNSQTGETVQATYWEDGSKAVLETGDAPEVSSFTGVEDVDHYREAGADFSDYSAPTASEEDVVVDKSGGADFTSIQNAIDSGTGDTIIVKTGTYSDFDVGRSVTLVAEHAPNSDSPVLVESETKKGITVEADDVTVKGFKVTNNDSAGIYLASGAANANVHYNWLVDNQGEAPVKSHNGIRVEKRSAYFTNNHIEGFQHGILVAKNPDSTGHVEIGQNSFERLGYDGVLLVGIDKDSEVAHSDHVITGNSFKDIRGVLDDGTKNGGAIVMYEVNAKIEDIRVERNRFVGSQVADIQTLGYTEDSQTVDAVQNYFGSNGIQLEADGEPSSEYVDASYTTLNSAVNSQGTDIRTFTRPLSEGTNMVSFPINQGTVGVDTVTGGMSSVDTVWTYQNGQWQELATGDSSDDYFRGGLGYIFDMTGQETLSVNVDHEFQTEMSSDQPSSPVSYNATAGWNLLGTLEEYDQSTGNAMSSLENAAGDKKYEVQNNPSEIETGHAYWTLMKEDGVYANAE